MRCFAITAALLYTISSVSSVADVRDIVRSSEQTAVALCLGNERDYSDLRLLCEDALALGHLTRSQKRHARYVLGNALSELREHAAARDVLGELLREHPGFIDAMEVLAWDYWLTDEDEAARSVFLEINDFQPTSESMAGLANILRRVDNDLPRALEAVEVALIIDPEYGWALREQGWIQADLAKLEDAMASFKAAMAIDPRDGNALQGASHVAAEDGRFDEALEFINAAIAIDARSSWSFSHRAYVLRHLDRNAQAIKEADVAIEIRPTSSDAHLQKMLALRDLGQIKAALAAADAAYEFGVDSSLLRYWHADILSDDAQLPSALDQIEEAIKGNAESGSYHELKSFILLEMGRHEGVVEASQQALDKDPGLSFAPYYAAIASYELGEQEKGRALIDKAIANDLPKQQFRYFLGFLVGKGLLTTAVDLRRKN